MKQHTYNLQLEWTGNDGEGTSSYKSYRRDHSIVSKESQQSLRRAIPVFAAIPRATTQRSFWLRASLPVICSGTCICVRSTK